jgi:hypothetical protein
LNFILGNICKKYIKISAFEIVQTKCTFQAKCPEINRFLCPEKVQNSTPKKGLMGTLPVSSTFQTCVHSKVNMSRDMCTVYSVHPAVLITAAICTGFKTDFN